MMIREEREEGIITCLSGTKSAFNPHSQPPPQTPAASFKSPYRKRLGSRCTRSPRLSCAEPFPIKASNYSSNAATSSHGTLDRIRTTQRPVGAADGPTR